MADLNRENIKGRGAQFQSKNKFEKYHYENDAFYADVNLDSDEHGVKTTYTEIFPKSILNEVKSPDIHLNWSMNPYQGCEHGCIYCYARPTHEYWGLGAGLDFERKIFYKKNAAALLKKVFDSKSWKPEAIMLSGNTDCYQPIEKKLELTRSLLKVCLEYKNPVGIITKNSLVERDLDLIIELAKDNLVEVVISFTSMNESLRQKLEPRTSSVNNKLKTIEILAQKNIPVEIIIGPVIPSLNSHEIPNIIEAAAGAGAKWASYTMVRLNDVVKDLFVDWVNIHFPDSAEKILNQIKEVNGGLLSNTIAGRRMSGNGDTAMLIKKMLQVNRKKFMKGSDFKFNVDAFKKPGSQLQLF